MIGPAEVGLLLLTAMFAVVTGINDGGALVANGLKIRTVGLSQAIGLLTLAVVIVPLVLGTRVATTLVSELVVLEGPTGQRALAIAVLAAMGVVLALARAGLPTSLTLAIIGGITGSGLGGGHLVGWAMVGRVLALAALAPLVGGALAFVLAGLSKRLTTPTSMGSVVGAGHRFAFTLQCIAYGANDGQKMLAVAMLGLGITATAGGALTAMLAFVASLFLLGTLVGVRRMAETLGTGVLASRPMNAVTAETAAGTAVLATAFLGAPVSMTQAVAGGLVGSGISDGTRRIRWRWVANIGLAWLVTLPAALLVAAGTAAMVEAAL
ncbi:MAG: inorganic phosphate transporter [Nitriliruptoraceae bacterium]